MTDDDDDDDARRRRRRTPAQDSQAKKGELSYHYWHGRHAGEAPAATAKKITEAEAKALAGGTASSKHASAWNAAGTWEERGHTEWARARLEALCVEHGKFVVDEAARAGFVGGGCGDDGDVVVARVEGVESCDGDASVVMIRGKPKHGFDFELKLGWSASFACERGGSGEDGDEDASKNVVVKVKGTIVVPEASRDGADDEECYFEVKVDDRKVEHKEKEDMCVKVLKARGEAFLVKTLKTLDAELRERASA